ncbi:MAG: hypothetical protein EPN39_15190 [Chitinophagaceae bacterium]|jgi:hypothetical protein|nr:MAG: hypothetical protein EPN39_15190 [Chitinophagaceae bacterium]
MYFIKKHRRYYLLMIIIMLITGIISCQKTKDYYLDSGLANPYFKGTTMDYLDSKPFYFDSVALVARLTGMDTVLSEDSVTFFAPTDRSIMRLINAANEDLFKFRYDTIKTLQDIPPAIWRKYLSRYIFPGLNQLKDYPQVDYNLLLNYPGQGYLSWDGTPMNIGVVYNDANGVQYAGYRQLSIAYIPDISNPTANWIIAYVASSNILTNNGIVHVLSDTHTYFGFDLDAFVADMESVMGHGGGTVK